MRHACKTGKRNCAQASPIRHGDGMNNRKTRLVVTAIFMALTGQQALAAEPVTIAERPAILHRSAAAGGQAAPTLIALHGGLGNADQLKSSFDLTAAADRYGFNLMYVNGTPQRRIGNRNTWNAGDCCGNAAKRQIDDVGYLEQVIGHLISDGIARPGSIYLTGTSNGAMMSYRMACERNDLIAGVIAFSGPFVTGQCRNARGVRIWQLHGLQDTTVPIDGGGKGQFLMGKPFPSVEETTRFLQSGGADVTVTLLPSASHRITSMAEAMQQDNHQNMADAIGDFID